MKGILKDIGYSILGLLSRLLIRIGVLEKQIIVRIDGGICSQMHFYVIGRWFAEKGIKVKYSIDWFEENGYDLNREHVRNFDLLKAFPLLEFEASSKVERFLYKSFRYTDPDNWKNVSEPCFLCGYYRFPEFATYLTKYFKVDYSVIDDNSQSLRHIIMSRNNSVAVHVRRGDLSIYIPEYGEPASIDYFKGAVDYCVGLLSNCFFVFFSDDPKWVHDYLVKELNLCGNYLIADDNGSDKGYMDLLLIATCNHQITSQGSLGGVGAILNDNPSRIVVCRDDVRNRMFFNNTTNIIYL